MTGGLEAGADNAVTAWFGAGFDRLHPLLQTLHRSSGKLSGPATLQFGKGLAGVLGRRMARKLGVPDVGGLHHLDIEIDHDETTLYWNRSFNQSLPVCSSFRPVGRWPDGHWVETTGPLVFLLAVDVIEGGWYWRVNSVRLNGVAVPLWLLPRSAAYKRIENGKYRFHVALALPMLGDVFSYSGLLELAREDTTDRQGNARREHEASGDHVGILCATSIGSNLDSVN